MARSSRTSSRPAPVPDQASLPLLREAARDCQACDLFEHATQTVFGDGPRKARVMLVGEQPGDQEDRQGKPFVGPAGKILSRAMSDAGILPSDVYVTNAVKHFKFEERGKRRIHKKPDTGQIEACRPWLDAELELVDPQVVIALGATAARALLRRSGVAIGASRGRLLPFRVDRRLLVTAHPSSILRARGDDRQRSYEALVRDLAVVPPALH